MRIALFTEVYLPHINGVVTHVKILKEGLEQLGHEVLVVTADASAAHHYIKDGILHCPAHTSKKFYSYSLSLPVSRSRLKLVREFKPDIIHVHNEFGIGFSGVLIAKILHVPLVYTLHTMYDDYVYYIVPKFLTKPSTKLSRKYISFYGAQANAITSPSQKGQEYFRIAGLDRNVEIIPNAVETEEFSDKQYDEETKAAIRQKHGIPPEAMVACFVGRLGREKSVDVLLDYWAEAVRPEDNMFLLIVGDGPVREELEQQAKQLGLENQVAFAGKIMHPDLPPYYSISDVYVTASLSDTNSISMLEGMCAGLPVLQRTDPLNADQVRDGSNGYNFNTAQEMAERLRFIQHMSPEDMQAFRKSVVESIRNSGARDLANHTLAAYAKAMESQKSKDALAETKPLHAIVHTIEVPAQKLHLQVKRLSSKGLHQLTRRFSDKNGKDDSPRT